ncbi:MAG TPA: NAD(P)/FAD-dependent oxidoreductase [Actinomycetes bacterium]|nr:NAD(P)/FAD-dependent oxidoreductase [Actinomycetes bacterium]
MSQANDRGARRKGLDVDAVVVGSGPNGLVAAITLAEAGWSVVVLEAAATYGGGTRTEELTLPGFAHDVCSTVHPLALASPAFRHLGLEREGLKLVHPEVPLGHPLEPGRSLYLHQDVGDTIAQLGRDAGAWQRTVGALGKRWQPLSDGVLEPLAIPPRAPVTTAAFGAAGLWPSTWFSQVAFREADTRALFAGLAAHATLDLAEPLTAAVGLLLGSLAHGVGWPVAQGGSQAIADALVHRLEALGGEIRTGHRVGSMADVPSARAVLFDVTPRQLLQIAGDRLPVDYRRKLASWRYGAGVFKVDWALDAPVPWVDPQLAGAGTVHIGASYHEMVASERAVARGQIPERPYVLLAQVSAADPSRAPAGKHTLWAYCHVPHGCDVDMTEAIEQQIERFAPTFRERILARHVMNPAALEAHNANEVGGDIAGGVSDWRQMAARPRLSLTPWATPDPAIFLCSSSTPPGGGVHGMCGRAAAQTVLRRWG